MEKYIYLFEISNNQDEYAKCSRFIDDMNSKCLKEYKEYLLQIKYQKTTQSLNKELLQGEGFQTWNGEDICDACKEVPIFIFRVMCSNEDDIVNLLYFCLLKKQHTRCILCIDSENLGKAAATIPYFLYDEIKKSMNEGMGYLSKKRAVELSYDQFEYFINTENNGFIPMTLPRQKIVKKFSTLIEIDQEKNTARLWGESVGNSLKKLYKKCGWNWDNNSDTEYIFSNYWPNIVPKKLQKEYKLEKGERISSRQNKLAEQYWEYRLFMIFTECFCMILDKDRIELTRARYRMLQSNRFFSIIKDMPLLALYIFSLFDVASKNELELKKTEDETIESLREQIFNARDMAEGLLQIIENVYHSEFHRGYFCFRIHTLVNGKNGYLMQNYQKYLQEGICNAEIDKQHILEIKVVDYSRQTIPNMFIKNFEKRKQKAEGDDLKKYEALSESASTVTLRSFFAPDKKESMFWQGYNDIAENIVHHYGLQAFDSFVMNNRGYFYVQSNDTYCLEQQKDFYDSLDEHHYNQTKKKATKKNYTLPGSQYEVLIPFQVELDTKNTLLNVNINYTSQLCKEYHIIESIPFTSESCISKFYQQPQSWTYQDKKEGMIHTLYKEFLQKISDHTEDDLVIWCSAKTIALSMVEIFCKVVMLYIANQVRDKNCYLMVTDCTESHFIEITRMIALFYNKQGASSIMKNVQLYLSGANNEEFLLAGNSLGAITTKAEKLAFARGVAPECVRLLNLMLKNKASDFTTEDIEIIPFDMLPFGNNGENLFERNVRSILQTDIQSEDFGCKLEGLHVRIGNKIHISTFYEAELLFHNNYYISRFAYWLAKEIRKTKLDASKQITLVGYETYSEMLLHELRELLSRLYHIDALQINCIIYEQKALEKFRAQRALYQYADSQFLLIVPINSTTTTHSKLAGFLQQELTSSWEQAIGDGFAPKINIIGNYGIVVIGSDTKPGKRLQKQYWKNVGRNVLYSEVLNDRITYFLSVKGTWHDPLQCVRCFSRTDYIHEQPLIETNKESIVPMHAIKVKRKHSETGTFSSWTREDRTELEKIKKLSEYLIYSHIVRKGNHFQYYFSTEKYMSDPKVEENVIEWLLQCRGDYNRSLKKEGIVFDVIVSPLHFSNAAFTNAVNKYFFNDAALVLHFDIEKEFRSNVKTKYNNLLTLYRNLCAYGVNAVINCHFMDDTIVSGATFMRARSLIESIFPNENTSVKVNIFASVIVLLSRLSLDSKRDYIKDTSHFYAYVNLQISSMRNHEDACVLCKKKNEYMMLAEHASLNEVYLYWKEKSGHYQYSDIEEYYVQYQEWLRKKPDEVELQREHATLKMMCSHKANLMLSRIENYTEDVIEEAIYTKLLMHNNQPVDLEEMIAYIKVIARPFICFSKEVKNAIFRIMLKMLDYLLMEEDVRHKLGEEYGRVKVCLAQIVKDNEMICQMVQILINRLVELGSNYIIRKKNMIRLLEHGRKTEDEKTFLFSYVNRVKQLIYNSTDEIKCLYLEYLLLYNEEYQGKRGVSQEFCFPTEEGERGRCLRMIFLENSRAIVNGIQYLCLEKDDTQESMENTLNHNYFLENYAHFLQFQRVLEKRVGVYRFIEGEFTKIQGMVRLRKQLDLIFMSDSKYIEKSERSAPENLYRELLANIKAATGADNGEFVIPYQNGKTVLYMPLDLKEYEENCTKFGDSILTQLIEQYHEELMNGTEKVIWDSEDSGEAASSGAYVLIRYGGLVKEGGISEIYLVLRFERVEITKLYISIKNSLAFRMDIWQVFNLTSNTLLHNWMSDRFYKQQMSKERAHRHMEKDELWKNLDRVIEKYENGSNSIDKELLGWYLSLAVDNLIGYYNVKILGKEFEDSAGMLKRCSLEEFWQGMQKIVNIASKLWNIRLVDRNQEFFDKKTLSGNIAKCKVGGKEAYPNFQVCKMLILSALKSIKDHPQGNNRDAIVYREEGYLYIKNKLTEDLDVVEKGIHRAKNREGSGISLPVIIDICRIWYEESQAVYIDREGCYFVVRLPIVEKEGIK